MGKLPTAHFASLVFGESGVALDDPAEAFHESSRLSPSVAPERYAIMGELGGPGQAPSVLAQTIDRASRTHEHCRAVALPEPTPLDGRLDELLARRRSRLDAVRRPISLAEVSTLLSATYRASEVAPGMTRRPVPSAGALYPLELYVIPLAVTGLEQGVYHYHPYRHGLNLLGTSTWDGLQGALVERGVLDSMAALLVITGVFWRSRLKYGARGYRFALLEAGHLAQNALLAAANLDLPALPLGGFYDRLLDRIVGVNGLDEATVHAVAIGGAR